MPKPALRVQRLAYLLVFITLLIYGLVVVRNFLYPVFLGVLLAFLFYPIASFLERKKIPRIVANLVCVIVFLFALYFFIKFLIHQFTPFLSDIPDLKNRLDSFLNKTIALVQAQFGISSEDQLFQIKRAIESFFISGGRIVRQAFTATVGTIGKLILLPVYLFFFLYYRDKFRNFLLQMSNIHEYKNSETVIDEISLVIRKYMTGVFKVVLTLVFLNTLGLYIIGHKHFLLLGVLSAICNFIPFIGTLIGGSLVLLFTFFVYTNLDMALSVVILYLIINFIENNILTPNIVGAYVSINPFVILLSIIIGGMLWGVPGMVIIVPFVSIYKIICDNIESLHPVAYLLSPRGTEHHALTWNKIKIFGKKIFKKR